MGGKRTGQRKHFLFYIACCFAILTMASCTSYLCRPAPAGEQHLLRAEYLMERGEFQGSLEEARVALESSPETLGDRALFLMGMAYVHPDNQHPDYEKSRQFFRRIIDEYQESTLRIEATVFIKVVEELEVKQLKLRQLNEALRSVEDREKKCSHKVEHFQREMEALRGQLDDLQIKMKKLKEVDIGIQEKKREGLRK